MHDTSFGWDKKASNCINWNNQINILRGQICFAIRNKEIILLWPDGCVQTLNSYVEWIAHVEYPNPPRRWY